METPKAIANYSPATRRTNADARRDARKEDRTPATTHTDADARANTGIPDEDEEASTGHQETPNATPQLSATRQVTTDATANRGDAVAQDDARRDKGPATATSATTCRGYADARGDARRDELAATSTHTHMPRRHAGHDDQDDATSWT